MEQKLTLLELNKLIQEAINLRFSESLWVVAEISELKINRNGHCYLELIEKDTEGDSIVAKSKATIWAFTFRMLKPYFESATGQELTAGLKVLVKIKLEYHEQFGLSLNVLDIDPNYTVGDLALKRTQTINRLIDEGVFEMNKELTFPEVPQKIAIISSETAAGYQDFIKQLNQNSFSYKFYTKLFPSIMQGENAEDSIIDSLERIFKYEDFFDLVVIIRGGGSQSDLQCFNNYLLSANVAQFPIPVLTGIGHDKDESVLEFEEKLDSLKDEIFGEILDNISDKKTELSHYSSILVPLVKNNLQSKSYQLELIKEKVLSESVNVVHYKSAYLKSLSDRVKFGVEKDIQRRLNQLLNWSMFLNHKVKIVFEKQYYRLDITENKLELLNPLKILARGYSMTYFNGKRLKNVNELNENDEIITKLFQGVIRSSVKSVKGDDEN